MKWKWGPINAKVTANEIGGIIMMVRIIQVFFSCPNDPNIN
jgi:hypothetical protein